MRLEISMMPLGSWESEFGFFLRYSDAKCCNTEEYGVGDLGVEEPCVLLLLCVNNDAMPFCVQYPLGR